ncbi:MAG: cytochrome P450, partial [Nannocystaceae bacterium]
APGHLGERAKLAYLPFGAGPRVCIGNHFALMEAKIILATVVQRFAIAVDDPASIAFDPSVTLRPAGGMKGRLQRLA